MQARRAAAFLTAVLIPLLSFSEELTVLKRLAVPGAAVPSGTLCEGVVVSDWRSANMDLNPNFTAAKLDLHASLKTAYVSTPDASFGVRLVFDSPSENRLERWDRVSFCLDGCSVETDARTGAVTVRGLTGRSVLGASHGEPLPPKLRTVGELRDSDIYTLVTLRDIDVVFKDGSWANVHEEYAPFCPELHSDVDYTAQGRMDGWATLLRDARGDELYMLVNLMCPWRRDGRGVPQGSGDVRGIVVHTELPRYGGNIGRYSIRPADREDIMISSGKSAWKTLVAWEKPSETGSKLDFEIMGTVGNLFKEGRRNDRILNDAGGSTAWFWTDSGSEIRVFSGYNALDAKGKGFVPYGSIMFIGRSADWFEWSSDTEVSDSRAFWFSFSTKRQKSGTLQFNFEWSAGTQDGNRSWGFPAEWTVECSIDGRTWDRLRETATGAESFILRPVPWRTGKIAGSGHDFAKSPSFDSGIGPQQRSFTLPQYALGQQEVLIRLSPASTAMSSVRVRFLSPTVSGNITRKDTDRETWIRFESVKIDYRQ